MGKKCVVGKEDVVGKEGLVEKERMWWRRIKDDGGKFGKKSKETVRGSIAESMKDYCGKEGKRRG